MSASVQGGTPEIFQRVCHVPKYKLPGSAAKCVVGLIPSLGEQGNGEERGRGEGIGLEWGTFFSFSFFLDFRVNVLLEFFLFCFVFFIAVF